MIALNNFEDIKITWHYNDFWCEYIGYVNKIHHFSIKKEKLHKLSLNTTFKLYEVVYIYRNKSYDAIGFHLLLKNAKEKAKKYYMNRLTKELQGIYDNIK